ncbi:hypothetical protein RFI_03110 [Reticulomyxa filosa]|uniref:Uncharacterized protein n=1 Tax=Reticulomyxa filosa TaxID=46433 RepID=X6P713_RETFI|nr:hypothetical protein RFI_03110 [Reticulomyxa filosa]|eukprot:ETO33986.1 hypothetical protein RFI_03110 [Reticulomyxa filosa]
MISISVVSNILYLVNFFFRVYISQKIIPQYKKLLCLQLLKMSLFFFTKSFDMATSFVLQSTKPASKNYLFDSNDDEIAKTVAKSDDEEEGDKSQLKKKKQTHPEASSKPMMKGKLGEIWPFSIQPTCIETRHKGSNQTSTKQWRHDFGQTDLAIQSKKEIAKKREEEAEHVSHMNVNLVEHRLNIFDNAKSDWTIIASAKIVRRVIFCLCKEIIVIPIYF